MLGAATPALEPWLFPFMDRKLSSWFARRPRPTPTASADPAELYEYAAPSPQNAVNLFDGWSHAFAPELGVSAGATHLFADPRIAWAISQFGSLEGRSVLELGPLEASHTQMLERAGAARIDAIEANKQAYLRCLVAKEIYGLTRSRFHLGDFVAALEAPTRYDLVVASGVLYHMADPVGLLRRIAARADALYLWTHYFDETEMPAGDPRRGAFRSTVRPFEETTRTEFVDSVKIVLHFRSYHSAWKNPQYCGGPRDRHFWMEKGQLIAALGALGYNSLAVAHEAPNHENGPSISIFARRV